MNKKSPEYYFGRYKKIEAKDVVLDFQHDNYNLGTALTYIMRAGKKPGNPITQDIQKAIHHLEMELEHQLKNLQKDETIRNESDRVSECLQQDQPLSLHRWESTRTDQVRSVGRNDSTSTIGGQECED
jgi:hypothetical protein